MIGLSSFVFYTKQGQHDSYNTVLLGSYKLSDKTKIICGIGYIKNGQSYLTSTLELEKISIGANFGFKNDASHRRFGGNVAYRFNSCE